MPIGHQVQPNDVNSMINSFLKDSAVFIEDQIKSQWQQLQSFRQLLRKNPEDNFALTQVQNLSASLQQNIHSILKLRADSEFIMPETQQIVNTFQYESFEFTVDESWKPFITEADYDSFNNTSSFVGTVTYDRDANEMSIILNGKEYDFCNVPARKFEGFRGASSQGAFFNREIKGQHDC